MSRAAAAALTALQAQGGGAPPEELLGVPEVVSLDHVSGEDLRYGLRVKVTGAALTVSLTPPEGTDLSLLQDKYLILPETSHPTEEDYKVFGYWYNLNEQVGDEPTVAEGHPTPDYWIRVDIAINYTADNIRIQTVNSSPEIGPSIQEYWDTNLPDTRITWKAKLNADTEVSMYGNLPWDFMIENQGLDVAPFEFVCTNPDPEDPEWEPVGPLHPNLFGADVSEYGVELLRTNDFDDLLTNFRAQTAVLDMPDAGFLTLGQGNGTGSRSSFFLVTSEINSLTVSLQIGAGRSHVVAFDHDVDVQFEVAEGFAPLPAFFNNPVQITAGEAFRFTGVDFLSDGNDNCLRYIIERFNSLGVAGLV
jgi:hypothetical protein